MTTLTPLYLEKSEIASLVNRLHQTNCRRESNSIKIKLIRSQIPYLYHLVNLYRYSNSTEKQDMVAAAIEALNSFLDIYDPSRASIQTAAKWKIIDAILRAKPNHKLILNKIRQKKAIQTLKKSGVPVTMQSLKSKLAESNTAYYPDYSEQLSDTIEDVNWDSPVDSLLTSEEHEVAREELAKLSKEELDIVLLRLEGVSWIKIADQLGRTLYGVKADYRRAFSRLKKNISRRLTA